jgi:leucyl-tRNA synthetase
MSKLQKIKLIEDNIKEYICNNETEIDITKPKYFATFPYPYMNGKLHLGHGFTMCKVDFECRWKQINGYNVLFPFGFHCTGMPISASAKKLEKEFETGKIEHMEKMTQYEILALSGVPKDEIYKFVNPKYWIEYFPKYGLEDITKMGLMVDKRRSFVTTDINPFYDSFIKWQFTKLKEKGYLKYGTRNSIYSENLKIQCQDHDRSIGEGVQIELFTIVEYKLKNDTKKIYVWIPFMDTFENISQKIKTIKFNSKILFNEYYDTVNDKYILITPYFYSNYKEQYGELKLINQEIIIKKDDVYDLETNVLFVNNFDCLYSNMLGGEIKLVNDIDNENKNYKLLVNKIELPTEQVVDRMGGTCIVKALPQWYIDYSNLEWKNETLKCIETMNLHSEIKTKLIMTVTKLREWGVSRPFGLGSHLPFDENLLIDSLSDSTIYPAYYTISHLIHNDLFGQDSKYDVKQFTKEVWNYIFCDNNLEEKIEIEFMEDIKKMKKSFEYFYPVDMRISGKDLINNHLPMYIYNHVAIFDKKHYPISINCNGWVLVDGKKMAKSEGNFITISDILKTDSIDAVRLTLADSGDSLDDANYIKSNASNSNVLKIFNWIDVIEKYIIEINDNTTTNYIDLMFAQVFLNLTNNIIKNYSCQKYKFVVRDCFYEWTNFREKYKTYSKYFNENVNKNLFKIIIESQIILLYPIMPHIATHMWNNILKNKDISKVIYNDYVIKTNYDEEILEKFQLMEDIITSARTKIARLINKKKNINEIKISIDTKLIDDFIKKIIIMQLKQIVIFEHTDTTKPIINITTN